MTKNDESATTARRTDAERNRARILDAARAALDEPGAEASMAEIARRAGVGSATLYRNFANRRELLEALYVDEIEEICAAARVSGSGSPGDALVDWLRQFYDYFTSKLPLADELLASTDPDAPVFATGYTQVHDAGRPLLETAQEAGEIRDDLTLEQILAYVGAVGKIPGTPEHRRPILEAALDSLRLVAREDHEPSPPRD
jgi:AcrR family transcriptional regulator